METKTDSSVAKTAYGKTLETPISYKWEFSAYKTTDELVAAKDEMTLEQQMKQRNTERNAKARSAALTAALAAAGYVKPTAENDPQVALRDMVKSMLAVKDPKTGEKKFTEEKAREIASMTLGIEWED